MKIFYVPIRNEISIFNYNNSIINRVTFDHKPINAILKENFRVNNYGLWGFHDGKGNYSQFQKMLPGNLLLFINKNHNKYQCIDGIGYIHSTIHDEEISKYSWNDNSYSLLTIINKYIKFNNPIELVKSMDINTFPKIENLPDTLWHKGYDMFREWDLKGFDTGIFIETLLNFYQHKVLYNV